MEESTTREKILKKIRAAILNKTADPFPNLDSESHVFIQRNEDPVLVFSDQFAEAGGKFVLCDTELEFVEGLLDLCEHYKWSNIYCNDDGLSNLLTECEFPHHYDELTNEVDVVLSTCECLISRTGSIVISSMSNNGFVLPINAPVHIVLARRSQIAIEMKDALHWLKNKYNKIPTGTTFITGIGDIRSPDEKAVSSIKGKVQLYIFLIDDKDQALIESAPEEEGTV